jgi:hypothetical protein
MRPEPELRKNLVDLADLRGAVAIRQASRQREPEDGVFGYINPLAQTLVGGRLMPRSMRL